MYEVTMPKLSDSMEVGKIIEWKVSEGDEVQEGDVLAEVESDKAVMELECFRNGVVKKLVHGDEEEVPVGEVIAFIAVEGEEEEEATPEAEEEAPGEAEEEVEEEAPEAAAEEAEEEAKEVEEEPEPVAEEEAAEEEETVEAPAAAEEEAAPEPAERDAEEERVAISPYARKLAEKHGVDYASIEGSGPDGRIVARDIQQAAGAKAEQAPQAEEEEERPAPAGPVNAEPLAAALAVRYGLDLSEVEGSGDKGRVTVEDVVSARSAAAAEQAPTPPDEEMPELEISEEEADVEEAPFRLKTQARRVIGSQHAIPHFYVTRGVDVTELMSRKDELKEEHGATVTHLVMLACVKTLQEHPEINRSYDRGRVIKWKGINLGLAVDTDQGLTVAVLQDAGDLSLAELVEAAGELVEKARSGKLSAEERRHATFTVTNLGMFDVEHFEPIINPPSSITLAVSSALETGVVRDGELTVGRVMKLTAACDHRIIDGATAAEFLHDLRLLLENPDELLSDT
ncbi:MAG: 2-oxo acid dehydrogenase subunit E2 [Candidatus Brocadiia bacterium]